LDSTGKDGLASAILGSPELGIFENLYAAYAAEAQKTAMRMVDGDPDMAADAVHAAYLQLLRRLLGGERWYDPARARAAVLRNTRWAAYNVLRARRRQTRAASATMPGDTDIAADVEWARSEARALCDQVVTALPARHRTALALRFAEGLSNREAAERLGVSVEAFESLLSRALRAARRSARSVGLGFAMPALAGWIHSVATRPDRPPARQPPRPVRARLAIVAGAAALATPLVVHLTQAAGATPVPITNLVRSATAPTGSTMVDTIDDVTITGAALVASDPAHQTVMAIGVGRECICRLVFRTTDGGRSWEAVPDEEGGARPVATRAADALRIQGAGTATLDFPQTGGVRCSYDEGATWAPRCGGG
jgi:RNA polymerase sigma-70 factor (ECF subfamily)